MRTSLRVSLALLMALALSTPVYAQSPLDRISFSASIGPSFGTVGTTVSTTAGLNLQLNEGVSLVGEFGMLPRAPYRDALEVAPSFGADSSRVNAYHWNGNLKVEPFEHRAFSPYVTAGLGSFAADAMGESRVLDGLTVEDRRRVTDLATNLGAGMLFRIKEWVGLNADYRMFFVHRDDRDPRVHRFATGLSVFLK